MELKEKINSGFTIKQTADLLGLSTKTIYNYINKHILPAIKWNGIWMIENRAIIELQFTLNRIKTEPLNLGRMPSKAHEKGFWVDKEHYEDVLRKSGQLQAAEDLLRQYRSENERLLAKNHELENALQRLEHEKKRRGILGRFRRGRRKEGSRPGG